MDGIEQWIEKGIDCLIPIYAPELGNGTKLILQDGSIDTDQRTVKTILKRICRYYTIHIEAYREKYGKLLAQQLGIPLWIHRGLLFIPLKMRKPMFSKDGAYGYINLYAIQTVKEEKCYTAIFLQNGIKIRCLHRIQTVQQQINRARVIVGSHLYSMKKEKQMNDFKEENMEDRPATKKDIANLRKEILILKDILKEILISSKSK